MLKSAAYRLVRGAVHPLSWFINVVLYAWRDARAAQIRSILVFKLDNLGDFVIALPALLALRRSFPAARFTFVASGQCAQVARLFGGEVVRYDSPFFYPYRGSVGIARIPALARTVARIPADLIVDFRSDPLTLLVALLSEARYRVEIGAQRILPTLRKLVPGYRQTAARHESEIYLRAVQAIGRGETLPCRGRDAAEFLPADVRTAVLGRLVEGRLARAQNGYVVMHIGGSAAYKRWPCERFLELAARLHERVGAISVLVGSPAERQLLPGCRVLPEFVIDLVGETDVDTLFAVVRKAALVVANDSAVGHIAAFQGRPLVSIYGGPSSATAFGPRGCAPTRVLQGACKCRSAEQDQCAAGEAGWCLNGVTVDRVEREAAALLAMNTAAAMEAT